MTTTARTLAALAAVGLLASCAATDSGPRPPWQDNLGAGLRSMAASLERSNRVNEQRKFDQQILDLMRQQTAAMNGLTKGLLPRRNRLLTAW